MMARGFKPVGWVAGVAAAALGCYMLSLNVAAERADLAKLEWRIVTAKREIRSLQTELGTRGRLQQLESWNANVLALSAPAANQFLPNELTLARYDQREKTIAESAPVHMASADAVQAPPPAVQPPSAQPKIDAPVRYASASAPSAGEQRQLVHSASLVIGERAPEPRAKKPEPEPKQALAEPKKAPAKRPALIDDGLVRDIRAAARAENKGGAGGQ